MVVHQNTELQLSLTREDIPVLSAHISTADDPSPSQQNNSSMDQDPPQILSEL